jgi:putative SOS response-associated peptidase YedK
MSRKEGWDATPTPGDTPHVRPLHPHLVWRLCRQEFGLANEPELFPRYNIAPTQLVAAVREMPTGQGREMVFLRWGLIPSWADDLSIGNRMINARSETAAVKPSFRKAFRSRRCLVVADGFYEWQKTGGGKQAYLIGLRDNQPFGLAGLWERWEKGGEPVESCTILTTEANELMRPIHDRMPVIIPKEQYGQWLDPRSQDVEELDKFLVPFPAEGLRAYRVSSVVNNARNDVPQCVQAIP